MVKEKGIATPNALYFAMELSLTLQGFELSVDGVGEGSLFSSRQSDIGKLCHWDLPLFDFEKTQSKGCPVISRQWEKKL